MRCCLDLFAGFIAIPMIKRRPSTCNFDDETYKRTAASFDNPDFVEVVIHSYRHRMGNADGDPRYAALEARLASLPKISVPTIVIHGAVDDANPSQKPEGHFR
jgi:hypothetical protein